MEIIEEVVRKLRNLREYKDDDEGIAFYYVPVLDQGYLNKIYSSSNNVHLIILCDKQKKLKVPIELLNIEILNVQATRLALIPNRFLPVHKRLKGAELEKMQGFHKKIPILLKTDSMSIINGFKPGDIIKIYRLDGSIYFRRAE